MCDTVLSLARDHLFSFFTEAANMIKGLPKEVADMKDELERIQAFIHDADTMDAGSEVNTHDRIKRRVKQLIEIAFRMEDVIDEYMIYKEQQTRNDPGCAALCEMVNFIKTMIPRLQIAYKMKDINLWIHEIKESSKSDNGFQIQSFQKQGPSSSRGNWNVPWQNLRDAPLYMDEAEIVGFEAPRDKLVAWLVKGRAERTIIPVVGMGGQGKTTLAKKVFDNQKVIGHFDCRVWITVSQSYSTERLLREMLQKICKEKMKSSPLDISTMDRGSLINEMRKHLHQERAQFTGAEETKADPGGTKGIQKIPIQKTQSFKEKKQGGQNWFQRQFARKTSRDHDSRDMEHAAALAAAAFAINLHDDSEQKSETAEALLTRTKSKVDSTKSPISLLGSASKRFSSSFRSKDDQAGKVPKSSVTDERKPEEAITPAPSMKKTSTFTDKKPETLAPIVPPQPIRKTSTKPGPLKELTTPTDAERNTKADEWERTELEKIRERYDKLRETIDSWASQKKKKATRKLNREESQLVRRKLNASENFQNKIKCIDQIAEGARTKAAESRRTEEIKAIEKANLIRKTGKLQRICFCF